MPVTTADVLFTYEVGRNPQSAISNAELYRRITGIDAKDDKTFTLHVDKLTFDYAAINDFMLLPAHIEREAFADPAQYRMRTRYATDPTNPGLYNGPYRISEFATGSHMLLEPNPHWAGPPGHFRRITVRTIENTAALEANLLSGTIDMIAGELGLPLDEGARLREAARRGVPDHLQARSGLRAYRSQSRPAGLGRPAGARGADPRARPRGDQPIAVRRPAAGRRQLREPARSSATRSRHAALPLRPGRAPRRCWRRRDGARERDGIRRNAEGQQLSLELMTTAGNRSRELVEQVLQSQWRRIGVDIRIKNEPARVLFGETLPHRRFDMAMYAWISSPENVPRSILHSSEIPSEANGFVGQNATGFTNPEMDRLIDALEIELDRRQAQSAVGRGAASLRDRTAVPAALFPLGCVHPAEMAERSSPDRQPIPDDAVDHRLVGAAVTYR